MRLKTSLTGNLEIDKVLKGLPKKLSKKVIVSALRGSAKPLVTASRNKAPESDGFYKNPGQLKRSLGVITSKYRKKELAGIIVGPRVKGAFARQNEKGQYDKSGFYGKFVTFGTDRGIEPNPFMEEAYEQTQNQIENAFALEIGKSLHRFMKSTIKRNK